MKVTKKRLQELLGPPKFLRDQAELAAPRVGTVNGLAWTSAGGEMLVVSQFTLYANCRHGNRPDFLASARPEAAVPLYEYFLELARRALPHVACGVFGADMQVSLTNSGPVTILLDTDALKKGK